LKLRDSENVILRILLEVFPKQKDRKGQNAKNFKGITKTFFQSLSYNASLIENAHNILTPSPMSGYSLDWAETKTVKVQSI